MTFEDSKIELEESRSKFIVINFVFIFKFLRKLLKK